MKARSLRKTSNTSIIAAIACVVVLLGLALLHTRQTIVLKEFGITLPRLAQLRGVSAGYGAPSPPHDLYAVYGFSIASHLKGSNEPINADMGRRLFKLI